MVSPNRTARTALLREVLDVAIAVGRRAEADGSPVPGPLRPVLSMARVGSRALAAADRAGDDDAFRALVAEAVAPEELDDAGRLWLTRPPGWEGQLEELVRRQVDAAGEARPATLAVKTTPATRVLHAMLSPGDDAVVGIGQPVVVRLDRPVKNEADRAAVVAPEQP